MTEVRVHLDDELVCFTDAQVRSGRARSMDELVGNALNKQILASEEPDDDDLDRLAEWAADQPLTVE